MIKRLKLLFGSDSVPGILLLLSALLAIIFVNTQGLSSFYEHFIHTHITIGIGSLKLDETLHFWVNDALMAIFFFVIGLELKREMVEGQLRHFSQVFLPSFAALGGVIAPALIFTALNYSDNFDLRGWAIPTATDIAFAVGVLTLLGKKVPTSLKIFVLTLAIMDDLCAIVIIALFYTSQLHLIYLLLTFVGLIILILMNKLGIEEKLPYIIVSIIVWIFVLHSGIHATIAGVLCAFTIPLNCKKSKRSMSKELEASLEHFISFLVLPLFAFTNAGVNLKGIGIENLFEPVPLGIMLGLFFGKQIGIFLFSFMAVKFKFAYLPERSTWFQLYAISIICGIGFTMSLFVDALAYNNSDKFLHTDKLAILLGSIISGIVGYIIAVASSKVAIKDKS